LRAFLDKTWSFGTQKTEYGSPDIATSFREKAQVSQEIALNMMSWSPDFESTSRENMEFCSKKHSISAGHPVMRPVLDKTCSFPTKTVPMSWPPHIETSFRVNAQFSDENSEFVLGTRY